MLAVLAAASTAAALSVSKPSIGPSFACARAKTTVDRAICADPVASAADRRMALVYRSARNRLSPGGRLLLLDNQRRFLSRARNQCSVGGIGLYGAGQTTAKCIAQQHGGRADTLANAVMYAGGRTFLTLVVERSKSTGPSSDGNLPPEASETLRSVRIDRPRTTAERQWNDRMERWLREGIALAPSALRFESAEDPSMTTVEVVVNSASRDVISMTLANSYYGGGPHGSYVTRNVLWSLRLGRALTNRDLFVDPASHKLRRAIASRFNDGRSSGCEQPTVAGRVPAIAKDGLIFAYDPYDLGAYTCGGYSRISWAAVRPFLHRQLAIDRASLERPSRMHRHRR